MGTFTRRALRAEATDDKFAVADDAMTQCAGSWLGELEPLDIFDVAAAIADEVVMLLVFGIITGGTAFGGDLANETSFDEVVEIVVGGSAGGARIDAVDGFEDLGCGGVLVVRHKKRHDGVALRGATQTAILEFLANFLHVHRRLDYV